MPQKKSALNETVNEESLPTSNERSFDEYIEEHSTRIRDIADEYRQRFRYISSSNTIGHSVCVCVCVCVLVESSKVRLLNYIEFSSIIIF